VPPPWPHLTFPVLTNVIRYVLNNLRLRRPGAGDGGTDIVKSARSSGARRVEDSPDPKSTESPPDYREGFEVSLSPTDTRSAEEWSRSVFEEAAPPVRWFLLVGWRAVLGLRLGPRPSPDHVLGWRIVSSEPDRIRLELRSSLMTSTLKLVVSGSTVVLATNVHYAGSTARVLWTALGPVHRTVLPYLLGRAAASAPTTAL
jgi:Protein of unknown function (DUF2867)